jgi:hypothetical protein
MRLGLQSLIQQIRGSAEQLASIAKSIISLAETDINIVSDGQESIERLIYVMTERGMSAEEIASNMNIFSTSVEETSISVLRMTNSIASIANSVADLEKQTQGTISTQVEEESQEAEQEAETQSTKKNE